MMGVSDFRASAERWRAQEDLAAVEGIRFEDAPGWANWAVPLGETWIELIGLADPQAAGQDPRARMFSAVVSGGDRLLGWALAPTDLDTVADRLGLPISRQRGTDARTGEQFVWSQAGFDETRLEPYLPFFVGWDHDIHADMARSTAEIGNAHAKQSEIRLELSGDPERLRRWLGDIEAPVSISHGDPGIVAHIPTSRGQLTVR